MARRPRETFECPNCGEDVPAGALACPACGSDEETGWSEDTEYDGLGLPDSAFGEDDAALDQARAPRRVAVKLIAAVLIVVMLLWVLSMAL